MRARPLEDGGWRSLLRFILPFIWPHGDKELRWRIVIAFLCIIAAKAVNIAIPFFLKFTVDALSVEAVAAIPLAALLGYGAARLGSSFFPQARDAIFARVGQRAGRRLALRIFTHLFDLSLRFHLQRRTGELARAIDRGVKALSFLLRTALFNLVPTLIEFALVVGILFWNYPPIFGGIVFTTISVYAVFTVLTTNWRTLIRRQMNERDNQFNAAAVDGLLNYEVVKAFANEDLERRRLDRSLEAYEEVATRSETSLALLNFGQAAIIAVGLTSIMVFAAQGVVRGTMTAGDLVLLNAFILQLYQPLNFLGVVYREIKQSVTDLENIQTLTSLVPEVQDHPEADDLVLHEGAVRFEDVRFHYDERRGILDGVSLAVPGGRKLAVVGPSGAGKSTIVRLLFRFYDAQAGRVLIDGQDVREVTQASLRRAIGLVPQDTILFNDTIGANIAYGRPDATPAEIEEAARRAQIDAFVRSLPEGYDTLVGERGLKLSGGEKQRVAIARVMLEDPPILVLDEATSALDSATEQALQEALGRASSGRTTLVIAHRLSTIIDADEIVVLEQGRIVERGDHATLLARQGLYAAMWRRQQSAEPAEALPVPAQ